MKVNPRLAPLLVPVAKLHLDPKNSRLHNERNLDAIERSLRDHGQQKPIVALHDGTVIAGNGTFRVATERLGATELAVVYYDGTEDGARKFKIADNRTAELAEWDDATLAEELKAMSVDGFDLTDVGFTEDELAKLLKEDAGPEDFKDLDEETVETNTTCPSCGYKWNG